MTDGSEHVYYLPADKAVYKPNKERPKGHMQLITIHIPKKDLRALHHWVRQEYFPNRSEMIRFAVKKLLLELRSFSSFELQLIQGGLKVGVAPEEEEIPEYKKPDPGKERQK